MGASTGAEHAGRSTAQGGVVSQLPLPRPMPLVPWLRDPLPQRQRTKKGSHIVRHMVPYWHPGGERELARLVQLWVEADPSR